MNLKKHKCTKCVPEYSSKKKLYMVKKKYEHMPEIKSR